MEFLKTVLGDELFKQVEDKINAYNGNDENKEKIKIGNLGSGEYVAKGKHDAELQKIQALLDGKTSELDTANGLISDLKKDTKDSEDLQGKISDYESKVSALQKALEETKVRYAVRDALREAKAVDVDYLAFKLDSKLKSDGKSIELDENGTVKGWNDMISGLKTQFPNQFEGVGSKKIDEHKLEKSSGESVLTRAEILKKPYAERNRIYEENPEAYKEAMNN